MPERVPNLCNSPLAKPRHPGRQSPRRPRSFPASTSPTTFASSSTDDNAPSFSVVFPRAKQDPAMRVPLIAPPLPCEEIIPSYAASVFNRSLTVTHSAWVDTFMGFPLL